MAFTTMQMYEHDLFVQQLSNYFPGAKAWAEVRGWYDPRPMFAIRFKNGVQFESENKHDVINQAKAYFDTTVRLTGEAP